MTHPTARTESLPWRVLAPNGECIAQFAWLYDAQAYLDHYDGRGFRAEMVVHLSPRPEAGAAKKGAEHDTHCCHRPG